MSTEREICLKFFQDLYNGVPKDQWLTLFSFNRSTSERKTTWERVGDLDLLVNDAMELGETSCVWYGVATRKTKLDFGRGGADDCVLIPGLWVDIDFEGPGHKSSQLPPSDEAARTLLEGFSPPTFIVRTGGGLQPYWVFDHPRPIDAEMKKGLDKWAYAWQEASAAKGWAIDSVWDVARILRVPGTYNRKNKPQLVTLEEG